MATIRRPGVLWVVDMSFLMHTRLREIEKDFVNISDFKICDSCRSISIKCRRGEQATDI